MLSDKQINEMTEAFCKAVDDDIQLQKDINLFADLIVDKLMKRINDPTPTVDEFNDRRFAFTISYTNRSINENYVKAKMAGIHMPQSSMWVYKDIYNIREYDVDKQAEIKKLTPEKSCAKNGTFEYVKGESLRYQIHGAIVTLLFREFDIEMGAEELEETDD